MEPSKNHNFVQFHSPEHGDQDRGPESQVFKMDPSGYANASLRSPEITFSEAKPVLNYSIQTGEEFALEFMRDRVNPRKPFVSNISEDSSHAPAYLELKGLLGLSHTGSESGSDISMIGAAEKDSREFERKNLSLHGINVNHGSFQTRQLVPHGPSDYNSRTLTHTSSGACDSSKLKVLCSFGGRILPRPSDGKLRYVGGETRIIRISKDITWKELWRKTTALYDQTCTIKYQLPGEDLDALVSISSDEDLLNMMEECNILEDGDASKKLRMFLFSPADLDDAHFSLANSNGDSEMKYVVAVNGMDIGSRKGSTLCGLRSSSINNLNELDTLTVDKGTTKIASEYVAVIYETDLRFNHGPVQPDQERQHPPQFGYNFHPPYYTPSESAVPQSFHGPYSEQKGLEGMSIHSSGALGTKAHEKEAKLKVDGLIQTESEGEQMLANEHYVPSQAQSDNTKISFPVEESPVMVPKLDREFSSKGNGRPEEAVLLSKPLDDVMQSELPTTSGNEYFTSEGLPVRVDSSGAGLLSRISKSDDSRSSQFLINQSHTDTSQQDLITTAVENLEKGSGHIPTEQSISTEKDFPEEPKTLDNGLIRTQNLKQTEALEVKESMKENQFNAEKEPGMELPTVIHGDSVKHSDNSTVHQVGRVDSQSVACDAHDHPQPSTFPGTREEPNDGVPRTEQGDILIDINDRFPRDLLSDIFSKAVLSDKTGRDEFTRRDVSLIDQDHVMFSSGLTKVEEEAPLAYDFVPVTRDGFLPSHRGVQENYGEDDQKDISGRDGAVATADHTNYNAPQVKVSESMQYGDLMDNIRIRESEYEDGVGNIGLPHLDLSLVDFDISSLQIIKNADLEELRELGSGTFGTVYHGKWRGSDVAIKRIKKSCFTGRQSEQERLTVEFWREAEILSKLHHPNVVAFYGVVQDGPGGTLATVTEYMVDGSLRHVLLRKDRHLDRRKRLIIAMDAAFGMEYLHSKNIVHFDLKCDNLLVNLKDPSRPICKVGDFGLSKIKRNTLVSGGVRGTLPWMAPELLNGSSNKVSEKILTGEEPYANMHYGAIIGGIVNNTLRPTIPSYCDAEWRRLMEQCWAPNPAIRPSFTEIASRLRVMSASAQTRKASS
ncbi:UNVERIFIED_CONTAM: putative serine/threonine-protein kinase SIS8 [Sesamum latifolium]|uniref:Serine/threonine-protein kinase SIS8 n=1 Tax=Sesamum latifolium TaxID=2727402 RepID=A0AAW2TRI8_9LAMI